MAAILPHSVILHIPKTAGKYVREVIRANGIPMWQTSRNMPCEGIQWHLNGMKSSHCIPYRDRFYQERPQRLCFVRHPLTWYQSYWAFRMQRDDWRLDAIFDRRCKADTFEEFVDKVLAEYPCGFLRDVYKVYTDECTAVGKMENLEQDLSAFVKEHEECRLVFNVDRMNVSESKWKAAARYRPDQIQAIMQLETGIVDEYGYNYVPDGLAEEHDEPQEEESEADRKVREWRATMPHM